MNKLLLLALLPAAAPALTLNLDAEKLKDAAGQPMPVTGLVVLTAGTSATFPGPTPGNFASGDEIVLKKWDLSAFNTPGVLQDTTSELAFTGSWNEGDPLRLYWYPTLNINSPEPAFGTPYGTYRDAVGIAGSAPWTTPAASALTELKFFTSDATFLSNGGTNPSTAGKADFIVVPEPSVAAVNLLGLAAVSLRRRKVRS